MQEIGRHEANIDYCANYKDVWPDGNKIDKIEHGLYAPVDWTRFQHEDCNTYGPPDDLLGLNQYVCSHSQILSI